MRAAGALADNAALGVASSRFAAPSLRYGPSGDTTPRAAATADRRGLMADSRCTSTTVTGNEYDVPEGFTSQSRYTLFRPSDCPNNRDHLTHRRAPPRPRHRLRQPIPRSNPTTLPKSRTTPPRRIPTQRRTARTLRTSQLAVLNRLPHPPDHRHQRNAGACAPRNPRCPCSPTKPEQCDKSSLARSEIIRKIPHGFT